MGLKLELLSLKHLHDAPYAGCTVIPECTSVDDPAHCTPKQCTRDINTPYLGCIVPDCTGPDDTFTGCMCVGVDDPYDCKPKICTASVSYPGCYNIDTAEYYTEMAPGHACSQQAEGLHWTPGGDISSEACRRLCSEKTSALAQSGGSPECIAYDYNSSITHVVGDEAPFSSNCTHYYSTSSQCSAGNLISRFCIDSPVSNKQCYFKTSAL